MGLLSNKIILIISTEPWSHIFVSKHHYAIQLAARDNKVYFLNPPNKKYRHITLISTEYQNVFELNYNGFIKGIRFLPRFLQQKIIYNKLKKIEKVFRSQVDIVWSFDNSVFFDFKAFPSRIFTINHIVDLNQDFEFERASSTASICIGNTRQIVDKLTKNNSNTYFINHGFNKVDLGEQVTLPGENKVKAMYAGNLDIPYLDWETLGKIFSEHPNIDFILAGNMRKTKSQLEFSNVYHIGVLPSNALPAYYATSDLLILCYKAKEHSDQLANPHKMMEYLGSGKPIVASYTEEYIKLAQDGLIAMANIDGDLNEMFSHVFKNIKNWSTEKLKSKRQSFALDNTYEKQLDRIEMLISSAINRSKYG